LEEREAADFSPGKAKAVHYEKGKKYLLQACGFCSKTEDEAYLIAVKKKGQGHVDMHQVPARTDTRLAPAAASLPLYRKKPAGNYPQAFYSRKQLA